MVKLILSAILLLWLAPAPADNAWSRLARPLPGEARAIGFYSAGCLAGAAALPLTGQGYQVMRPSRNRYYGHPELIAFIERLARAAAARGERLLIGDLSQPRGGPMSYGHSSHQVGLDVDVWFFQPSGPLSRRETENLAMRSVVDAAGARLNGRWTSRYREVLEHAARDPKVARIFVNPVIKQALCRQSKGQGWLRKIRPWWGHDAHFHVRLHCPAASPRCRAQDPPPPGDGCDANLDQWVRELQQAAIAPPEPKPRPPRKPRVLPAACTAVLNGYAIR